MQKPIAITPGEPAGIGPDILVKYFANQPKLPFPLVAIADRHLLSDRAKQLGYPLKCISYEKYLKNPKQYASELIVLHFPLKETAMAGKLNRSNCEYVLHTIKQAVLGCLQGEFAAMVTGPVHKGIINEAGVRFFGHTDYLAELTHSQKTVMMLANKKMKVALATTHLPLKEVPQAITEELLKDTIHIIHNDLQNCFRISSPKILVCGLNPHAGENGHLGIEEKTIITPTLNNLREQGIDVIGPIPADSAFTPDSLSKGDIVLAMYHDQGLAVFKALGFGESVNVTLGLPIIRTSVDHGTALTLAGSGNADHGSLASAIELAMLLSEGENDP